MILKAMVLKWFVRYLNTLTNYLIRTDKTSHFLILQKALIAIEIIDLLVHFYWLMQYFIFMYYLDKIDSTIF